jgi:hypothetical protein
MVFSLVSAIFARMLFSHWMETTRVTVSSHVAHFCVRSVTVWDEASGVVLVSVAVAISIVVVASAASVVLVIVVLSSTVAIAVVVVVVAHVADHVL